ncbi:hypothetical protein BS47DRAFT_1339679 [Hydnum rufescens UP504]|uniref:Uncharacterized protein n=1 Tax=Hydnum rufescens UP504 TaxID=1448309 RepID=A0A9P6B449_9AGAM|nr:hypothetical protein BS47DRAFT_1339679 [Hydnum rufescens UP504]
MAFLPASSTKTFKGLISPHPSDFFLNLSTYTRADPKHDVRAHLLLCAMSLQVWTHLHPLGVELVPQQSPQVFPYHSHPAQRR